MENFIYLNIIFLNNRLKEFSVMKDTAFTGLWYSLLLKRDNGGFWILPADHSDPAVRTRNAMRKAEWYWMSRWDPTEGSYTMVSILLPQVLIVFGRFDIYLNRVVYAIFLMLAHAANLFMSVCKICWSEILLPLFHYT